MIDGGRHRRWTGQTAFEKDLLKSDSEIRGCATVKMNLNVFRYTAAGATRDEFEDVTVKLMPGVISLSKRVTITPPYEYQNDHLEIRIAMSKRFNGLLLDNTRTRRIRCLRGVRKYLKQALWKAGWQWHDSKRGKLRKNGGRCAGSISRHGHEAGH